MNNDGCVAQLVEQEPFKLLAGGFESPRTHKSQEGKRMTDLFETPELLPQAVQAAIDRCWQESETGCAYRACQRLAEVLTPLGLEFDWGLDGVPYNLVDITVK